MAYRARTLAGPPHEPNAYARMGVPRTVDGVNLTGRCQVFTGTPSKVLLEDDCVDVQTLQADAYPNSSCDRNAVKNTLSMHLKKIAGEWPTDREKSLDEFAERKLAHPEDTAMQMFKAQGMTVAEARAAYAQAQLNSRNIPVLDPPKGARKTA